MSAIDANSQPLSFRQAAAFVAALVFAVVGLVVTLSLVLEAAFPQRPDYGRLLRDVVSGNEGFARGFLAACGSPCFITHNGGGKIGDFKALAERINDERHPVVIAGGCYSACTLMADLARVHVRITDAARFHFHAVSDGSTPDNSPDIKAWVKAHGGYPTQSSGDWTVMSYTEAKAFWRTWTPPILTIRREVRP